MAGWVGVGRCAVGGSGRLLNPPRQHAHETETSQSGREGETHVLLLKNAAAAAVTATAEENTEEEEET